MKYETWLRKKGLDRGSIKKKRKELGSPLEIPSYKVENRVPLSNTIPSNGTLSPDMDKARFSTENYPIMPAYNKGPYQVISREDVKHAGKKNSQ